MKSQQQHRADQLEELLSAHLDQNVSAQMQPGAPDGVDPEVREMAMLAQHLQASPPLMPDPAFIQRLERKVLVHSVHHAQTRRGKGLSLSAQNSWHWFSGLVKGKVLATTLVCTVLLGSMGVALAATPAGHNLVESLPGVHATVSPAHKPEKKDPNQGTATADASNQGQKGNANACAGLSTAQQLAAKFSLSTERNSSAIQVICSLHDGSFHATVDGKSVTVDHPLGYGEIAQLLTYAQVVVIKGGEKLNESNVQETVATILNACGSTPTMLCVNSKMGGNEQNNGGKSKATPTPRTDGKPFWFLTPHADWNPTSTPSANR